MLKFNNDSSESITGSEYEARSLQPLKQGSSLRRYDSRGGNPKQWSPDVNMLLSTSRWLEVYFWTCFYESRLNFNPRKKEEIY